MKFAIITNQGRPIQNPAEQIADLTEAKLKPLSTKSQVRKAVLESIAELETLTKQETLRLESRHH